MGAGSRTLLVTGGAGFIGSALIRRLIRDTAHRVVNVDALTYAGSLTSLAEVAASERYHFEQVDIRDAGAVRELFDTHSPHAVIHLAAESHVDRSIDGPAVFLETNVIGTFTLLEASLDALARRTAQERAAFRFLHVSTDEVYGSADAGVRFDESSRYAPNSPYAASKAAADHLVRAWGATYGLPVLTTNCSNNYGPYQFPEKLIPQMILRAIEGRPLPVYGDGRQVRDWLHVDDHVRALLAVLDEAAPGEYFNIGAEEEHANVDVVHRICDILDDERPRADGGSYREQIEHVPDRPGHDRRYAVDASRLAGTLGWRASITFDDGLRETVRWYLANESWWRPLRERVYHGDRLGHAANMGAPVSRAAQNAAGEQL